MVQVKPGEGLIARRLPPRIRHLGIIVFLFAGLTFFYFVDYIALVRGWHWSQSFSTGVHDLHRTLFIFPIIYAALVFGLRGSLVASFAFLCIVLPRALYVSLYPNPLLRALISVASASVIGVLVAAWRRELNLERSDKEMLSAAYDEVKKYGQQLEENQKMLIGAERLASMGQLAASIAHEVNNPLSGVLVYVQLMKKKISKGNLEASVLLDYLTKIDSEVSRCTKLIRNLLDFSSQSEPNIQDVDCSELLDKALDLAVHARTGDCRVETHAAVLPPVKADPDQLQEVLVNLAINAFQAMPQGGTLSVRAYVENEEVRIAFADTGCGIPAENMSKIFTPFFSTKKDVKGVGLGLPVSYGIMQRLNGRIEVQSRVGEGSTFTVCIPLPAP